MAILWESPQNRRHGRVGSCAELGVNDHVCLAYESRAEFRRAAVEYLSDGRRRGQRLLYSDMGTEDELIE